MDESASDREQADVLAGRICAAASLSARSECQLLELIGEFDAAGAIRWWLDVKSLAHWLSWTCSMTAGTAREHVRVARAMRQMPTVTAAFRDGRLSYSKVREVTRVVGVLDEGQLCAMAQTATASQLSRMLRAYRSTIGSRIGQERRRAMSWVEREDGMVDLRIRLPKEEAAVMLAAVSAAKDQFGGPPPQAERVRSDPVESEWELAQVDGSPRYGDADAILDVARSFLAAAPQDLSGEDRTLVVVHVAAEQLAAGAVPGGDVQDSDTAGHVPAGHVPAGVSDATCHVQGVGGIEPATAARLACDTEVLAALVGAGGEVLALGRNRRLVSRGQRRALMIRDGMCQFPGCHQLRHLDAHHVVAWSRGGPTDLDNLVLLCRFHHTAVHEGGMTIVRAAEPAAGRRWDVVMPDGSAPYAWWHADTLARQLAEQSDHRRQAELAAEFDAVIEGVDGFGHPDARRILPGWAGERFDIHECVQALYRMQIVEDVQEVWVAA